MFKQKIHLLRLDKMPIFEQLQIEEALLRADDRNWCIMNQGSPEAIVMGISGKPEELIHRENYIKTPAPLIRRFSGGGTVFIDFNTLFTTFIGHRNLLQNEKCYPETILHWAANHYREALPNTFAVRENDFVIGDCKFGGNALYIRKDRWLQHASLLWDYSKENMATLKLPTKAPQYRERRDHSEFLCKLKDHLPSPNALFDKIIRSLEKTFEVHVETFTALNIPTPNRHTTTIETELMLSLT